MHDVLRLWLERGVDGFRLDAVFRISKDPRLRDSAPDGGPPNDWLLCFRAAGGAWTFDQSTGGQWYLHSFLPQCHQSLVAQRRTEPDDQLGCGGRGAPTLMDGKRTLGG